MKKIIFLILAMFLTLASLNAQDSKDTTLVIAFDTIVYNYGTIEQGSEGTCEFKFTNKGKSPLILTNVQSSCGCSVPTWPKAPVEPGKTGIIKVKYNTGIMGSFSKSITVTSNAINSRVVLTIQGNVINKK